MLLALQAYPIFLAVQVTHNNLQQQKCLVRLAEAISLHPMSLGGVLQELEGVQEAETRLVHGTTRNLLLTQGLLARARGKLNPTQLSRQSRLSMF